MNCAGFARCSASLAVLCACSIVTVSGHSSCPKACRVLIDPPGLGPVSPALEGRFFGPPGKSLGS